MTKPIVAMLLTVGSILAVAGCTSGGGNSEGQREAALAEHRQHSQAEHYDRSGAIPDR